MVAFGWGSNAALRIIQEYERQRTVRHNERHEQPRLEDRPMARALCHVADGRWSIARYDAWFARFYRGKACASPAAIPNKRPKDRFDDCPISKAENAAARARGVAKARQARQDQLARKRAQHKARQLYGGPQRPAPPF